MTLFGLTFTAPFLLLGLLTLPLIWWLLRLTPPRPQQEVFPPTRILGEIAKHEETPAHSPWWLTLLRLLMAALIILALSEPVWNAQEKTLSAEGPVLIVVDDGWASGEDWQERIGTADVLLNEAEESGRPVALAFATEGVKANLDAGSPADARKRLIAAVPKPVPGDPAALATKATQIASGTFGSIIWFSDGLQQAGTTELAAEFGRLGAQETIFFDGAGRRTIAASAVQNTPEAMAVTLEQVEGGPARTGSVTAYDLQGRSLSSASFEFADGEREAEARFDMPVELRNEIVRIAVDDAASAGAVQMLDERFRRRRVGLISGARSERAEQPLLSPLYYISRALSPFSDVRETDDANLAKAVPQLIADGASTLVLADIGTLPDAVDTALREWIEKGGMLVRFAGPRLASAESDDLLPVELRKGDRNLGGTLTWGTAQPLARFTEDSPFSGLSVPPDVTISRQVLAEPSIDLAEKTWASLADGTPLVTATQRGEGWIVLFHVSADAGWSNLPLSGAFVDMLRRIVAVSNGAVAAEFARKAAQGGGTEEASNSDNAASLSPWRLLDGYGVASAPPSNARPISSAATTISLDHPPGLYGSNDAFVALNLFSSPAQLTALDPSILPAGTLRRGLVAAQAFALMPWLLAAALILLLIDCAAVLWMSGALRRVPKLAATASAALLLVAFQPSEPGFAQGLSEEMQNSLRTRLAYVKTGSRRLDEISRKGLEGLTQFIASRTSLEPAAPVGVDISSDELAFFPLLYWPVDEDSVAPNEATMARVDAFMKKGGSVLFDTRDQLSGGFAAGVTPATLKLRQILQSLDVPPLEPVPDNHVLTRAFYLLNVFPGRYLDGRLWVETSGVAGEDEIDRPARPGDGVSSIMITSNDFAGAWAVEADGSNSLPVVPPNPTQRIYAYRTGVNIVMYTLTGNYKSDQVHIPALLERLGQ